MMRVQRLERVVEDLQRRVEMLELALDTILKKIPEVRMNIEVPKVILKKKTVHVKISEDEIHGRILSLAVEGFLKDWRTIGEIISELIRRGWAPKDFKKVNLALEHLTSMGLIERKIVKKHRSKKNRMKWIYRASPDLPSRIELEQ
ncbi:MAG: hypothetical protein QXK95_03990 [Nitrososphaerota archaeon]|nr:hypothetical protein [Candidatus Geocrenenecus dongiae]